MIQTYCCNGQQVLFELESLEGPNGPHSYGRWLPGDAGQGTVVLLLVASLVGSLDFFFKMDFY